MRIVITDTAKIWNVDNPYLEKFKDIVTVVCLDGHAVTDKYQCFIVNNEDNIQAEDFEDLRLKKLLFVEERLEKSFGYREDIVFLCDSEPSTLYPLIAVQKYIKHNRLHLVAIPPLDFEIEEKHLYSEMLSDLSGIDSVFYYDTEKAYHEVYNNPNAGMDEYRCIVREEVGKILISILNGIYSMKSYPSFFDLSSLSYLPLDNGYRNIISNKRHDIDEKILFKIQREYSLLGSVAPVRYPEEKGYVKDEVSRTEARIDGKKVCNILRAQRLKLAKANGIILNSEECSAIGPCAGTCEKCEEELEYLSRMMNKIVKIKRVYPKFDPEREMKL